MQNNFNRFIKELLIVKNILPFSSFLRWMSGIPKCAKALSKTKSLGVLDDEFGNSFVVLWNNKYLRFDNLGFGVVREIYGHNCYVKKGELKEAHHILDLGANGGAFTVFALTEAPNAEVYSVEAQPELIEILKNNIEQNGYEKRAVIECAVVGGFYDEWTKSLRESHPQVKEFNIHEYISHVGTCDFLKCDVEGGEFPLFEGDLTWTQAVKRMALEYHPNQGNVDELEKLLNQQGFQIKKVDHGVLGYFYCTRD
jgi:FkbM family methyltransferase